MSPAKFLQVDWMLSGNMLMHIKNKRGSKQNKAPQNHLESDLESIQTREKNIFYPP